MKQKEFRRILGFVATRLEQIGLEGVCDPRQARGKRWELRQAIGVCLVGMLAGCKSLGEVERLTASLSRSVRRRLHIPRRVPDTTLHDILCRLEHPSLQKVLERVVMAAHARKALTPTRLPLSMVAMDGKATWVPSWGDGYAQKHNPPEDGLPYGLLRTVTGTLACAPGRPCIAVSPIPARTNEMGHFIPAFHELCDRYGALFTLVSYDQGANSEVNARAVLARGKHYLFRLNDQRRRMQQLATDLLGVMEPLCETVDLEAKNIEVVRRLQLMRVNRGILPKGRKSELWGHAQTLLCVTTDRRVDGVVTQTERRYYASSLPAVELTSEQWLAAIRAHWSVETTHQILDTSFREDDRPWIRSNTKGMLALIVLRRIAYTLLTLYRSVTQRSGDKRERLWQELLELVRDALVACTEATIENVRHRKALLAAL
jgi:hypothetical protein